MAEAKVNGVLYNRVREDATTGQLTLSSTKHPAILTTSMDELKTYYGRRTAYEVHELLRSGGKG